MAPAILPALRVALPEPYRPAAHRLELAAVFLARPSPPLIRSVVLRI
jgi:hypothetical protein